MRRRREPHDLDPLTARPLFKLAHKTNANSRGAFVVRVNEHQLFVRDEVIAVNHW